MAPLQSTLVICNVKDEDFAREVAILENMQIRMVSLYSMLSRYFYSCYRCFFWCCFFLRNETFTYKLSFKKVQVFFLSRQLIWGKIAAGPSPNVHI